MSVMNNFFKLVDWKNCSSHSLFSLKIWLCNIEIIINQFLNGKGILAKRMMMIVYLKTNRCELKKKIIARM